MENNKYVVYTHINKITNKLYIGITKQKPERRWQNGYGYIKNTHFYRSIQKYGWEGFNHVILFENLSYEIAAEIEKFLIIKYNTQNLHYGYNIAKGGEGGHEYSEEDREKMRKARLGKFLSEETKNKISNANKGVNNAMYGKHLSDDAKKKISKAHKGKKHSDETRLKMSISQLVSQNKKAQKINQYTKEGKFIKTWNSINMASRELKINQSNISGTCMNYRNIAGGYIWRYFDDNTNDLENVKSRKDIKSVNQYDLNQNFIKTWNSISEINTVLNLDKSSITKCCKGKYKTVGGFIWRYTN